MIVGESILQTKFIHDDKRNAVGQRPLFIGTASKQLQTFLKKRFVRRNNCDIRRGAQKREQVEDCGAFGWGSATVSYFDQDPRGGHERAVGRRGKRLGGSVRNIFFVQQSEKEKSVREGGTNDPARLGAP